MSKAYSYLRFSTPEQAQGDSRRRQSEMARAYATKHGLELDESLTFHDLGVSAHRGKNAEAGALGAFLQAVDAGLIEPGSTLLVESLDRISRQTVRRAVRTMEEIVERGITIVDLGDSARSYSAETLDADPVAFLIMGLRFIRAHEESALKGRRLRESWVAKRREAASVVMTARGPAWLKLGSDRTWHVVPERAAVVRRIYEMAAAGRGQHAIAQTLNSEGVPRFGGGAAGHWQRSYVVKLLNNPAVVGTCVPHVTEHVEGRRVRKPQEAIEGYFPAAVDRELYESVQASRVGTLNPRRGKHAAKPVQNILGGLARCPICAGSMTRVTKGSSGRAGRPYLVCAKAKAGGGCEYRAVPLEQVEDALRTRATAIVHDAPAGELGNELDLEANSVSAEIDVLEDSLSNLLTALEGGPSPAVRDRVRETERALESAKRREAAVLRRISAMQGPLVSRRLGHLETTLSSEPLDLQEANSALRQCLTGVTVDYRAGLLRFAWLHGGTSVTLFAWPEQEAA